MSNPQLNIEQIQKTYPRLILFNRLLQMNLPELETHIRQMAEENPMIEIDSLSPPGESVMLSTEDLSRSPEESHYGAIRPGEGVLYESTLSDPYNPGDSLSAFLLDQISRLHLDSALFSVCDYFVNSLDENGFLEQDLIDHLSSMGVPEEVLLNALSVIQSLEPAGIGARNVRESLLLQVQRFPESDLRNKLSFVIKNNFDCLAKRNADLLSRKTGYEKSDSVRILDAISGLNPKPGSSFSSYTTPVYIYPDFLLSDKNGSVTIEFNHSFSPKIEANPYYLSMMNKTDDDAVRLYLQSKYADLLWLKTCLDRRKETLLRCMNAIVSVQSDYLSDRSAQLRPMTMRQIAEEIKVHPSTITRAIRGKYIQTKRGCILIKDLFLRCDFGTERSISADEIKKRIRGLLSAGNGGKRLSDAKIAEELQKEGIRISRRTVAKYRSEMHIPSSYYR